MLHFSSQFIHYITPLSESTTVVDYAKLHVEIGIQKVTVAKCFILPDFPGVIIAKVALKGIILSVWENKVW